MDEKQIDELKGRELDAAIEIELGARWLENPERKTYTLYEADMLARYPGLQKRRSTKWAEPNQRMPSWDISLPHYSTDIAAAWELDGEGWEWETYEDRFGLVIRVQHYNYAMYQDFFQRQSAFVKWSDFPTKSAAYAIARCRAWLKARAALVSETQGE